MSWSAINFDSYKEKIIELYQNNITREEIVSYLLLSYNVCVSIDTLQHCLNIWNISKWISTDDSLQLWARIATLFFECCASNEKILYILDQEDYIIDKWNLQHFWKKLDLNQQISQFDWKKADQKLHEIVQKKLDKKFIEKYKCEFLYHHFCNQMHFMFR